MDWQGVARCRGTDVVALFFGPEGETESARRLRERKAKVVCASCALRVECLDYALQNPSKYGIWGGLNRAERVIERRRRARRVRAA